MKTLLIFVSISLTFANLLLAAEPISPFHLGGSFAKTSREPKFNIELHPEDSPYSPEDEEEAVVMPNDDGISYRCYLPKVEKAKTGKQVSQANLSSMVMESVKKVELKTPDELLEGLKDQCFVRQEGWWSYEFCYEKRMRQVHLENDLMVQEFILGVFDAEATAAINENLSDISMLKDPRSKDAAQRYHPHQYKNGTTCDLTNQPRETEVRFVCSEPRTMISSITELSTCKYAVTIRSPVLCQHPLFQAERPVLYTIHCNVIPTDVKEANVAEDLKDQKIIALADIEDASDI